MDFCRIIVEGAPFVNEDGFTYHVPDFLKSYIEIGSMVYVPFGKGDALKKGIVIEEIDKSQASGIDKVKDIVMVHQLSPVVSTEMMALCEYLSDYYACAMIYTLKQAIPKYVWHHPFLAFEDAENGERTALTIKTLCQDAEKCKNGLFKMIDHDPLQEKPLVYYRIADKNELPAQSVKLKRAPKQQAMLQFIAEHSPVSSAELKEAFKNSHSATKALLDKGYIVESAPSAPQERLEKDPTLSTGLTMTQAQQEIFDALLEQLSTNGYHKSLINGVTGSGKTLIYEKLAEVVIEEDKQVLYLVPEIALSQQLFSRLQAHFGDRIVLLHSQLTERERYVIWRKVARQEVSIVLGPRSALFLPFKRLRLIIIDEEHESSFKQSEPDPRYHAVKVAEYLAARDRALLVLGSATPSMESLYEVVTKRCQIFNLPERVKEQAVLPEIVLVDMTEERKKGRHSIFSLPLREAVKKTLERQEQVILLINKKGFSSTTSCHECGEVIRCPRCDIPLTYYRSTNELKCNYCEFHMPMITACPNCGSDFLEQFGNGTESVVQECAQLFPDACIERLDAQALENESSRETILKRYEEKSIDILVGTQLLAKGLDFVNTTCIGVINADLTLNLPDFRSAERCFQLMVQVAGRAGRDQKKGYVYIQTFQKEHYALQDACQQNVHQFFLDEIAFRKKWLYPPIVHLCRVIVSDFERIDVESAMKIIYNYFVRLPIQKEIIGPSCAPLAKKNNRLHMHLLIKTVKIESIHSMTKAFRKDMRDLGLKRTTRVVVDVDPENIF